MAEKPNWEGFARDILGPGPVDDMTAKEIFETAIRNGIISPVPGGFDPRFHNDPHGIHQPGDPFFIPNYATGTIQ